MSTLWIEPKQYSELAQRYEQYLATEPETARELMAEACRTDLYFLLRYGLQRKDCHSRWVYERCQEVQDEPNDHLDLWAREHYKSTIITYGKTIQDFLIDPEVTIGLFSHTRPIAKAFLRQIKQELETNTILKGWFPDVLWEDPKRSAPKWSEDDGIIVKRRGKPKEATVEAWGVVDGQPTSKHFAVLVYDDIVTRESVTSPEMMAKTTEALSLSYNLGQAGGVRRFIGTRYHLNDSYRTIIQRGTAKPRLHPATANGKVDGDPVFLTRPQLTDKRMDMGPFVFACQMLQDPQADETQGFREDWLKYASANWRALNRYILVDPASAKKKTSDYTAGWVLGLAEDGNIYVLDMVRDRLSLTQRADLLFNWHRRWQPLGVGYEKYGKDADIEHIQDRMERENYRFVITELGGSMPKMDRIRRLIPWFEKGRIFLQPGLMKTNYEGKQVDLTRAFIDEEYLSFPVAAHDDMLDALARILDESMPVTWPRAWAGGDDEDEAEERGRNSVTGY